MSDKPIDDNNEFATGELSKTQNQTAAMQGQYNEERDLVNQLLGQTQMADAFAQFSLTVSTSKLAFVKENKLYKALAGQKTADGQQLSGAWEDFCKLLGRSRQQVDEDILNLKQLGEEALESMSRMGIGYREMRQYRKLPEDQKVALIEAAKTGDKDTFIDLAEEIISRGAKKEEQLNLELDEVKADYEAQSELLSKKSAEVDTTKLELEKARRRLQSMTQDEVVKDLRKEIGLVAYDIEMPMMCQLRDGFEQLAKAGDETGTDHRQFMAAQLKQIELRIIELRERFNLPEELGDDEFDWMNPETQARVAAHFENTTPLGETANESNDA